MYGTGGQSVCELPDHHRRYIYNFVMVPGFSDADQTDFFARRPVLNAMNRASSGGL